MKRLFLIDAYALVFKYYYAFFGRPMRNRAGMNTSILFGFTKFLRDIQKRENPDLLGVALDPKGGCFRCELYPEYKANRPETPEDIIASVPYLRRLLQAMRIPVYEIPGYEADDVIGTLAYRASEEGYDVYMVTPDKDYGQLVGPHRHIYKQKGDGIEIVREEDICSKYGITDPKLVRDILAIWGDASDNIPGVPGIGEKGACKIVGEWGEVENILANAQSIKGKQGEKIQAWGDKLLLSKRLAAICTDVPVEFSAEDLEICEPNYDELRALYAELDFTSFLREIPSQTAAPVVAAEPEAAQRPAKRKVAMDGQGDLFAMMAAPANQSVAPTAEQTPATPSVAADNPAEEDSSLPYATAATTPHEYTLVDNITDLQQVVERISR
ncbi:MAG: DNA polymerase I, partial [Alistipes sp.]|nr:DNA polymerase I [Alistipes sp.]